MPIAPIEEPEDEETSQEAIDYIKEHLLAQTQETGIAPIFYDQPDLNYKPAEGSYAYQQHAAEMALQYPHSMIEIATGGGKTNVALIVIDALKVPTLIVVNTIALMEQWGKVIEEAGGTPAFLGGGIAQIGSITIGVDKSVYAYIVQNQDTLKDFKLLIYDEVHHAFADQNYEIMEYAQKNDMKVVGLTATARTYEGAEKDLQDKFFPAYARYTRTLEQTLNSALGIPVQYEPLPVYLNSDERVQYDDDEDTLRAVRQKLHTSNMQEWQKILKTTKNQDIRSLIYAGLKAYNDENTLLASMPEKRVILLNILQNNPSDTFIIFTVTINDAVDLENYLTKNGISVVRYTSDLNKAAKQAALQAMQDHKAQVMIGIKSVGEGIDLPDLTGIIFYALTTKSPIQIVQKLGRVLRFKEGKVAKVYVTYAVNTKEEDVNRTIKNTLGGGVNG